MMATQEQKNTLDTKPYLTMERPKNRQCFFSIVNYFQGNCVHSTVYRTACIKKEENNKQIIDDWQAIQWTSYRIDDDWAGKPRENREALRLTYKREPNNVNANHESQNFESNAYTTKTGASY